MDTVAPPYEQRLAQDPSWAMSESGRYFDGTSKLQASLREIAKQLDDVGIDYVVIGGLALAAHGYVRMTDDIDILIERADLETLHRAVVGRGYRPAFEGSKTLRNTSTGVKIEFVLTDELPGDVKTDPIVRDGVKFIGLVGLVELKLGSGVSTHAVDVQQLIRALNLPREFADRLHAYVRPTFVELWAGLHASAKRFVRVISSPPEPDELARMQADGVEVEPGRLVSSDPDVATRWGLHDESEFFDPP